MGFYSIDYGTVRKAVQNDLPLHSSRPLFSWLWRSFSV